MTDAQTPERRKVLRIVRQAEAFIATWISNPAAQLDFVRLLQDVKDCPSRDHADEPLMEWLDEQKRSLRSIGVR